MITSHVHVALVQSETETPLFVNVGVLELEFTLSRIKLGPGGRMASHLDIVRCTTTVVPREETYIALEFSVICEWKIRDTLRR